MRGLLGSKVRSTAPACSLVNNTFRQVGSALGIAVLVAVIGSPVTTAELVDAHRAGWVMIATSMLLAALVGLRQIGAARTAD